MGINAANGFRPILFRRNDDLHLAQIEIKINVIKTDVTVMQSTLM